MRQLSYQRNLRAGRKSARWKASHRTVTALRVEEVFALVFCPCPRLYVEIPMGCIHTHDTSRVTSRAARSNVSSRRAQRSIREDNELPRCRGCNCEYASIRGASVIGIRHAILFSSGSSRQRVGNARASSGFLVERIRVIVGRARGSGCAGCDNYWCRAIYKAGR